MKKTNNNLKHNKNGITLIALVITIIVLLILAGVSIAMLTGQNGILTQAQNAKNKTEEAEREEKEKLGDMEDIIDEYATGIKIEQVIDENPGVLEGTGTDDEPYTINSIEDLIFFSYDVNDGNTYAGQTVKLALSLDFNSNKSYVEPLRANYGEYGYNGELKTLLTTGEGFKPIGAYLNSNTSINDETNTPFMGTFDGDGHEIDGIRIVSEEKGKGLFGLVKGANIKNLGIGENCFFNVNLVAGGIVGYTNAGTTIENCYNKANIMNINENAQQIGGIAGQNGIDCNIINCYNLGEINGNSLVGGIVGNNNIGNINNCYNSGNIKSNGNNGNVGGITGMSTGIINNCYNVALIQGNSHAVGGIVGFLGNNSKISNCYTSGNIVSLGGGAIAGGTTTEIKDDSMSNCYYLENTQNGNNGGYFKRN